MAFARKTHFPHFWHNIVDKVIFNWISTYTMLKVPFIKVL